MFSWMAGSIPGSSPGTAMTAGAAPQPNRTTGIAIRAMFSLQKSKSRAINFVSVEFVRP